MNFIFDALIQIRTNAIKIADSLTDSQLNSIPTGFNNNIIWNLGHMVASQQILCYKLGGAPLLVSDDFLSLYKKDSTPSLWTVAPSYSDIKEAFLTTNSAFQKDYQNNLFENYSEYKTSSGLVLKNSNDALVYNYGHENLHFGIIMNLKKLV
jgi:hypothetical protein